MASLDREIITRQIRESVDIVDVVGAYMALRRSGASFTGLCPFHQEKSPSFNVHPMRQTFKCFGCGAGGDIFTFIQLREKVDFVEARRILAERAGISLDTERSGRAAGPGKSDLVKVNEWAQSLFRRQLMSPAGEAARRYVAERGMSETSAQEFGLGLAMDQYEGLISESRKSGIAPPLLLAAGLVRQNDRGSVYDTFRNRLMFPIRDVTGRIIGFGGRTLGDDPAKYLNTPATALFDKSTNLFAIDRAKHAASEKARIIVVEGYTDCIMAHQCGFPETVATLGTAMTDAHAAMLKRYTDHAILLFDSDEAGQRAADRAIGVTLLSGLDVSLSKVPAGKDPCDYLLSAGEEAFEAMLKVGISALEFKWRLVAREFEAGESGPARRRAIDTYLHHLAAWVGHGVIDPIQKGLLVNQLSKILSLPAEELHRQLHRLTKQSRRTPVPVTATAGTTGKGEPGPRTTTARVSAEQRALRQIVEVLLNAPEHYGTVAGQFELAMIRDEGLRTVASELMAVLEEETAFRLDAFIGRFESAEFARLVTDLQATGERHGKSEEAIAGALACLASCTQSRQTTLLVDGLRRGTGEDEVDPAEPAPATEEERLLALAASARNPHFSPARIRKQFLQD